MRVRRKNKVCRAGTGSALPATARRSVTVRALQLLFCFGTAASAQVMDPAPKPAYLFPAGGQRGRTVEIIVCGQNLNRISDVIFEHPDIQGKFIHQFDSARPDPEKAREIRSGVMKAVPMVYSGRSLPGDLKEQLPDLMLFRPLKEGTPTQKDARRVYYEYLFDRVRPQPNQAMMQSASLRIDIPKAVEPGLYAMRLRSAGGVSGPLYFHVSDLPEITEAEPCTPDNSPVDPPFSIPLCINGQIYEGDIDIYQFWAKAGQELDLRVIARELRPFIADGVPGWFESIFTVYGPDGAELAYSDCTQYLPDPSLRLAVPESGVYTLALRDSIWRGRQDFVYRLLIQDAEEPKLPEFEYVLAEPGAVDEHPFIAKSGEKVAVRTVARTKGSPVDTWVQVVDSSGTVIAENDDFIPSFNIGRQTVFADSELMVKIPMSGNYKVLVSDTAQKGGSEYGYDLMIGRPRPEADLYVSPASVQCVPGQSIPLTFYAVRHYGFDDEIEIRLDNALNGFELDSAVIPKGQDRVTAVLNIPNDEFEGTLVFEGNGELGVTAVDDWEQAFIWHHLVQSDAFRVVVETPAFRRARRGGMGGRAPLHLERSGGGNVEFAKNRPVRVRFSSSWPLDDERFDFRIVEGPGCIRINEREIDGTRVELTLVSDEPVKEPGNLIIEVLMKMTPNREGGREIQIPVSTLPAIVYE